MWVLRRIPAEQTAPDLFSPWKGCLHIDLGGRAWYATSLAKPTQIAVQQDAEECREIIKIQFPEDEIRAVLYEDVFPRPILPPTHITTDIDRWNWNVNDDDVPF